MLLKYKKIISKKVICLTLSIYMISSIFIISRAENYEWTVINNDTVETNSSVEVENTESTSKDELNLDCESAILIEQNSRPSAIRKKFPRATPSSKCYKINDNLTNIRSTRSGTNKTR